MHRHMPFSVAILLVVALNVSAEDGPVLDSLPRDFAVYAVGSYSGTRSVNLQLDDSGHTVKQADVVVNKPDQTVVLVLTAYDPVVWRVGHTEGTKIAGILVSGYHGQALIGVDKSTPYAVSTHKKGGPFPYFYAYRASKKLLEMNESVQRLVGSEIRYFENQPRDGVFYIGDAPDDANSIVYSDDLRIEGYIKPEKLVGPEELLESLLEEKKLRPATQMDIDAWVDKASEKYRRFNPSLRVRTKMRIERTYVVLKELSLPVGMLGAKSRAFIIPDDVPFPECPRSHNTFYRMDGTATGTQARED